MIAEKKCRVDGFSLSCLSSFGLLPKCDFVQFVGGLVSKSVFFFIVILENNIVVISLILLGMTFYVNLVILDFFKKEKYAYVVLEHPQLFALIFAFIILFLSILKGANLFFGRIIIEALPIIFFVSAPIGIFEGYGIYITIKKTLNRTMFMKDLVRIYGIFMLAAVIEVGFTTLLR